MLFIDLDRFKEVNDSFGHKAGDELLLAVSERIGKRLREGDTIARLGGDEFVIVLEDLASGEDAATVAQEVVRQLGLPFDLPEAGTVRIGGSVGIALFPKDGLDAVQLLKNADQALYAAKSGGRNTFRFYSE